MGMVKESFMTLENDLDAVFKEVDSAVHKLRKLKAVYDTRRLDVALNLLVQAHNILDDEQQVLADVISGE